MVVENEYCTGLLRIEKFCCENWLGDPDKRAQQLSFESVQPNIVAQ